MPAGIRLRDGFSTTIDFSAFPNVSFWETEVTPPGASGGGENDTTTMRNTAWRTRQPKKLKTFTNASGVAAYDPRVYDDIAAMININQLITITFPDGSTLKFWGWLDEFTPNALTEGSQPTANFTIICSNEDNTGAEIAPDYTAGPTTTTSTTTTTTTTTP